MSEPNETAVPHAAELGATEIPQVVIEDGSQVRNERAFRLTRELQVTVTVDASGWLKDRVELRYQRGRGGTILPVLVRVGDDALDAAVLADGGVLARCGACNDALDQLRHLALRLGALVRDGLLVPVPGTATASGTTSWGDSMRSSHIARQRTWGSPSPGSMFSPWRLPTFRPGRDARTDRASRRTRRVRRLGRRYRGCPGRRGTHE